GAAYGADAEGSRRAARRCRSALLVRRLRTEGHPRCHQVEAGSRGIDGNERSEGARAPGEARHRARLCAGRRPQRQARQRNPQLVGVRRREEHQAGMSRGPWIDHFGDNFLWSNATLIIKGMAPYGVVALEEMDRACERLRGRQQEPNAWWEEWGALGDEIERRAEAAAAKGHRYSAGDYYIR